MHGQLFAPDSSADMSAASTAARIASPAFATARSASSSTFTNVKNPWICDPKCRCSTGTRAARSRSAQSNPSSRSGSCSAVITYAGGSPRQVPPRAAARRRG